MIPVIAISLLRSTERRTALTQHLEALGVPFKFFDAVDGADMTVGAARAACARRNPRRYGQYLLPSEIACAMSHRLVYADIACGEHEYVCVIEDDVTLAAGIHAVLDEAGLHQLPPFDVLRLHADSRRWVSIGGYQSITLRAPYRPAFGSYAQIFTRHGAAKAAAGLKSLWMPCDTTLFYDGLVPRFRILEANPALAHHPPAGIDRSTIDRAAIDYDPRNTTVYRRCRRDLHERITRLRAWRNFVKLWGFGALQKLEP